MNKQEAIEKIEKEKSNLNAWEDLTRNRALNDALAIVRKIDDPEKPKVPQVAVEFYERYKDDNLALGEWFGDFYSPEAIEEFPRMDELTKWLHDNNNETNRQREFALATLVTLGIDAVEVEKEKLYTAKLKSTGEYLHHDTDALKVHHSFAEDYTVKRLKTYHFTKDTLLKYSAWENDFYSVIEVEE